MKLYKSLEQCEQYRIKQLKELDTKREEKTRQPTLTRTRENKQ